MYVTPLNANRGLYFPTLFYLALRLQNSWVIRLGIMNELPVYMTCFACIMFYFLSI